MKNTVLILSLIFTGFISCSEKTETIPTETVETQQPVEDLSKQDTIKITLNSNDKMQFDQTELNVYAGQTVVLTLNHTGTMPAASMGHNFILLKPGTSMADFAKLAFDEKDNDYIPADKTNIIAHTDMIGGGESTTITFPAPEKGTYDFLCSFPGHYALMQGKFNVQ